MAMIDVEEFFLDKEAYNQRDREMTPEEIAERKARIKDQRAENKKKKEAFKQSQEYQNARSNRNSQGTSNSSVKQEATNKFSNTAQSNTATNNTAQSSSKPNNMNQATNNTAQSNTAQSGNKPNNMKQATNNPNFVMKEKSNLPAVATSNNVPAVSNTSTKMPTVGNVNINHTPIDIPNMSASNPSFLSKHKGKLALGALAGVGALAGYKYSNKNQ